MRLPLLAGIFAGAFIFSSSVATALTVTTIGPPEYPIHGSETRVTLQGTYTLATEPITTTLPNGDIKDTATYHTVRVTNREILVAMVEEGLINDIKGYSIVLVAHGHMASEARFFATSKKEAPVEIPLSLLNLQTLDGPTKGIDPDRLRGETRNYAQIHQGPFTGTSVLAQRWTSKVVEARFYPYTDDLVELVTATGTFQGALADDTGVGALTLKLSGAKAIDLHRYDMDYQPRAEPLPAGPLSSPVSAWYPFDYDWEEFWESQNPSPGGEDDDL